MEPPESPSLRHARLVAEREALVAALPSDPGPSYGQAAARVQRLKDERDALTHADGRGVLRGTPVGDAALALRRVVDEGGRYMAQAEHARLRERHQLHRQAAKALKRERPLRNAFNALAGPERDRIRAELPEAERKLAELAGQRDALANFSRAHPEALPRLIQLDRDIDAAAYDMDVEREPLDGIAPHRPEVPQLDRRFQRDDRVLERTIELDRGFGLEL